MKTMIDANQLIERYVEEGSEVAFRELVDRYVDFVYSTARRLVNGDSGLAEDVTQTVFVNLAKMAPSLSKAVSLGGWLHQHTFHVASKAIRGERRRQVRERTAAAIQAMQNEAQDVWEKLSPVLDEAIHRLGNDDRQAILLRFFEQQDFRTVGQALGTSEDAARMRVQRALGKLMGLLRERGVSLTGAALAGALASHAVSAAPVGLGAAAAGLALSQAATVAGSTLLIAHSMATAKLTIAGLALAGACTGLFLQHRSQVRERMETAALRQQLSSLQETNEALSNRLARANRNHGLKLPAPPLVGTTTWTAPLEGVATNLYALMTNRNVRLTPDQLKRYLEANQRNAASLLAAFRTSGDATMLAEAMQKYPDLPQVEFEAALQKGASPEERRHWLDALKTNASDNALGYYLSASDYFKAGKLDEGIRDLVAAAGKPAFQDYTLERTQDDEEAYRSAGFSVAESKLVASMQLVLPQLLDMRDLSGRIIDLANSYSQAGDQTSRQNALEIGAALGRRFTESTPGESLISELFGVALERQVLAAMDPSAPYNGGAQTVQQRLDELAQRRAAIRELNQQAERLWPTLNQDDWINYQSRSAAFGEHAALEWLVAKHGQP